MNELAKTGITCGVALVLAVLAAISGPGTPKSQVFDKQGEPFFPEFTDPQAATYLRVVQYDKADAAAAHFQVEFKDGKWVIPSHFNYPADASQRLADTSTMVIGIRMDKIQTERKEDHAACGVVDPEDPGSFEAGARGRRITLKDAGGKTLADFIIGKKAKDDGSQWFVRVPEQKRVYAAAMKVDLSTKFSDWIETDLMKIDPGAVWKVIMRDYRVKQDGGMASLEINENVQASKPKDDWVVEGMTAEEEVNSAAMGTMTSTLDTLKIVGVRRKPEGLTRDLKTGKGINLTPEVMTDLQNKGFYFHEDEGLLSKEGDVYVACEDGVTYLLRFGAVFTGSGMSLETGIEDPKAPPKAGTPTESRYLMISAFYDDKAVRPDGDDDPEPADPHKVDTRPWSIWRLEQAEKKLEDDHEKAVAAWHTRQAERTKKLGEKREKGRKRAKELTDRFAEWYYVIGADSFSKVRLSRKDMVKSKGKAPGIDPPPDDGDSETHDHKDGDGHDHEKEPENPK
jgi:hypothetical protein